MTESQKEYSKKYYQKNKEYFKERQKEWRKNNPERWRQLCKKHRDARAAKLKEQGVLNPYNVLNKRAEPRYEDK